MNKDREVMRQYLETRLEYKGREGRDCNYACPFCDPEVHVGTLHIDYNKGKEGMAICHSCGYGSRSLWRVIRDVFGGIPKQIDRLRQRTIFVKSVEQILEEPNGPLASDAGTGLPDSFQRLPRRSKGVSGKIRRYLYDRGVTYESIDEHGIGYVSDPRTRGYGYAIFPFWVRGQCVYWQGRLVPSVNGPRPRSAPKSYNPPGTEKDRWLYGFDQAENARTLFLCEGPLDSIAWGAGGIALSSLNIHTEQLRAISLMEAEEIIVCTDADAWSKSKRVYRRDGTHFQQKVPLYLAKAVSRTGKRVGVLRLKSYEDDAANVANRIHAIAEKRTQWRDGIVSEVDAILSRA